MPQYTEDLEYLVLGENPGQDTLQSLTKELKRLDFEKRFANFTNSKQTVEKPKHKEVSIAVLAD